MVAALKRRWFRFSLRTMFVLSTVATWACGWLGWQLRTVRTRQAIAAWMIEDDKKDWFKGRALEGDSRLWQVRPFNVIRPPSLVQDPPTTRQDLPAIRQWLGDRPYAVVVLRDKFVCPDARWWFPEATLVILNRDGATLKGPHQSLVLGPTFR